MKALIARAAFITLTLAGAACVWITGYPTPGPEDGDPWQLRGEPSGGIVGQISPDYNPRWTPDGNNIVFSLGATYGGWTWQLAGNEQPEQIPAYGGSIYMADVHGRSLTRVSLGESRTGYAEADVSPKVSPNGERLVYVTARHIDELEERPFWTRSFEVETAVLDGSRHTRLTTTPDVDSSPVWSPDGTRIAYISRSESRPEFPYQFHVPSIDTIKTMATDGSDVHIVFPTERHQESTFIETRRIWGGLVWLPESERLGFRTHDGFYTVRIDGSGLTQVHPLWPDRPERRISGPAAWTPDGEKVAFTRITEGPRVKYVYLLIADRQGEEKLHEFPDSDRIEEVTNVEWFPNGEALLISTVGYTGDTPDWRLTGRVFVVSRDGELVALLEGKGSYASLSPDGSRIALSGGYGQRPGFISPSVLYHSSPDVDSITYLAVANSDGSSYRPLVIADISAEGES